MNDDDYIRLQQIHESLIFRFGSLHEELEEQLMSVAFLNEKHVHISGILEIGGNIGRNSCVIGRLLFPNEHKLVVLESDPDIVHKLNYNKILNNLDFYIENCAISRVPLVQNSWDTRPESTHGHLHDWFSIPTRTWTELQRKYADITFNVLIVDAEGALYFILKEEPDFMKTFELVIVENDYTCIEHKQYVDNIFENNGFKKIYTKKNPRVDTILWDCFYEVWKKTL